VLVVVALVPRMTLWGLIELKMEILIQVAPLFMLGVHWSRLTAPAALAGLVAGLAVSFGLPMAGYPRPFGVHDGLIGAMANLLVCVAWSRAALARQPAMREAAV
jgi:SSS family solute:Na+ symporter/sodium/pantothenate symporter